MARTRRTDAETFFAHFERPVCHGCESPPLAVARTCRRTGEPAVSPQRVTPDERTLVPNAPRPSADRRDGGRPAHAASRRSARARGWLSARDAPAWISVLGDAG